MEDTMPRMGAEEEEEKKDGMPEADTAEGEGDKENNDADEMKKDDDEASKEEGEKSSDAVV